MAPSALRFSGRLHEASGRQARMGGWRRETWGTLNLQAGYEGVEAELSGDNDDDTNPFGIEDDEGPRFDENDLMRLKVPDLKQLCDSYGVSKTGKKGDIIERLLQAQADELGMTVKGVGELTDKMMDEEAAEAMVRAATGSEAIGVMAEMSEGELRFVTEPRTGNCWHGIIFDVQAKDHDINVVSINTASSPESQGPVREDKMNVQLYVCSASSVGNHKNPDVWTKIGSGRGVQLPVVAYGEMEAFYGPVPMESGPIKIKAGESRGFCVFSSSWRGVVLRSNLGSTFTAGDITEENEHMTLKAGLLPKNDRLFEDTMFAEVYHESKANAFVGAIGYTLA